jgi:hypothetical protein
VDGALGAGQPVTPSHTIIDPIRPALTAFGIRLAESICRADAILCGDAAEGAQFASMETMARSVSDIMNRELLVVGPNTETQVIRDLLRTQPFQGHARPSSRAVET